MEFWEKKDSNDKLQFADQWLAVAECDDTGWTQERWSYGFITPMEEYTLP